MRNFTWNAANQHQLAMLEWSYIFMIAAPADTESRGQSRLLCLVLGLLGLCGCASPEMREPLPLRAAPPFSASGETELPTRWWTVFKDEALDEQVERALAGNFSLVAAWERLGAAHAVVERTSADLWPHLDGVAGGERVQRTQGDSQSQLRLGFEASYEVDLWGRIESQVDAERFRASATRADYHTATLTLTAEVARTWYQLAEASMQLALIEEQVATNQAVLELIETRFAAGQVRSADVLRQRQLVEATREQAIIVGSRISVLRHLLATLQGRPPQQKIDITADRLPELSPIPSTGLPGELVRRRPDVRRTYLLIRAADEDLASAITAQYPRINLNAALLASSESPENLFREWLASIAGQIVAPLIDGGQRRAEVERTAAVTRQRLAEYGQATLNAFREVEDALALERHQLARIQNLESQLSFAQQTYDQLRTQYLNGVADYVAVLTALRELQQLQRDVLTARLTRLEFRVALYRALAGSFETARERDAAFPSQERTADE